MLGQGADAQLDRPQLIEMFGELVGRDADESRREATLGHERLRCTTSDAPHGLRHCHVFGEIEVVGVAFAGCFRHCRIAVVRQAGDDGLGLVKHEMVVERLRIAGVERDRP